MFIAKKPDLKKKCRVDLWIVTNFILIEIKCGGKVDLWFF